MLFIIPYSLNCQMQSLAPQNLPPPLDEPLRPRAVTDASRTLQYRRSARVCKSRHGRNGKTSMARWMTSSNCENHATRARPANPSYQATFAFHRPAGLRQPDVGTIRIEENVSRLEIAVQDASPWRRRARQADRFLKARPPLFLTLCPLGDQARRSFPLRLFFDFLQRCLTQCLPPSTSTTANRRFP